MCVCLYDSERTTQIRTFEIWGLQLMTELHIAPVRRRHCGVVGKKDRQSNRAGSCAFELVVAVVFSTWSDGHLFGNLSGECYGFALVVKKKRLIPQMPVAVVMNMPPP